MDFEPWWLISIPVLFALGWIAGRVDISQMLSETRRLPKSYFQGLNFLLNEEPDRAIDAFVEVAKLDPETTELHFALGSLFRRRGEMERAIRVHQSLLARADLPLADREMAQFELAEDFLKAGLLDRAEAAYSALLTTRYSESSLRALIRIYESGHEWVRAIDAVQKLQAMINEPVPAIVHYHCELATQALQAKPLNKEEVDQALQHAEQALEYLTDGQQQGAQARVAMLKAQLAGLENKLTEERQQLQFVLQQTPQYGALVAAQLLACFVAQEKAEEGVELLLNHYYHYPALDTFRVIFQALRTHASQNKAWEFARQALNKQPYLLGLDRVVESELAALTTLPPEEQADNTVLQESTPSFARLPQFELLHKIIHRHSQRLDRFACDTCGFEARHYYWQCPGCNNWETYQPRRLEEVK